MTRPAIFLSVHSSPGELSPQRRSTSSPLPSPAALTHSYHASAPPRGGPIRSGPGVRVRKGDLSHLRLRAQRVPGTCSLSATPPLVRGELRREANVYPEREAIRPMISHLPRAGHGEGMPQQIPGFPTVGVSVRILNPPAAESGPLPETRGCGRPWCVRSDGLLLGRRPKSENLAVAGTLQCTLSPRTSSQARASTQTRPPARFPAFPTSSDAGDAVRKKRPQGSEWMAVTAGSRLPSHTRARGWNLAEAYTSTCSRRDRILPHPTPRPPDDVPLGTPTLHVS